MGNTPPRPVPPSGGRGASADTVSEQNTKRVTRKREKCERKKEKRRKVEGNWKVENILNRTKYKQKATE
jgi:hypothetical protein